MIEFMQKVWALREYRATWLVIGASGANEYTIDFITWAIGKVI